MQEEKMQSMILKGAKTDINETRGRLKLEELILILMVLFSCCVRRSFAVSHKVLLSCHVMREIER